MDINKFVYGVEDDSQLRQQLVEIANTLGGCTDSQNEWVSFFNNPANAQAIKEAKGKYGLPVKNRPSYKPSGLFTKWVDYCDWGDIFRFYYYAKLSQDFPALNPNNPQNCYSIKALLAGLEQERVNVGKQYAASNDNERYKRQLEVIGEKVNDYNALFGTMACTQYMAEQDRIISEQQRIAALEKSQSINIDTFQKTAGTSGGGTKIALYVFGGAAVLVGIMFFAKRNS